MNAFVKLALDLGPLIVFFVVNSLHGIFPATAAFMAAIGASLAVSWVIFREVAPMPMITAVFVLIFGGLTLYLDNELFIKLKPTIVNLLFAAILFGGLAVRRPLLQPLLNSVIQLEARGWRLLTLRWALFFVFLALVNEIVWRNFSTDFWVSFKLFGIMPMTAIFGMAQVGLLKRYAPVAGDSPQQADIQS